DVRTSGKKIPLTQFNAYVTSTGYSIAGGAASFDSTVRWAKEGYTSKSHIALDQLGVGGAEGDSLFSQHFGIPLSLALALMRDTSGRIALDVPVVGDSRGTHVAIGTLVAQALERAILGAITSPLKLLGAIAGLGGKIEGVAPEPIGYTA